MTPAAIASLARLPGRCANGYTRDQHAAGYCRCSTISARVEPVAWDGRPAPRAESGGAS